MTTPARIEVVFFDVGGTLLDEMDANAWSEVAAELGIVVAADHLAHAYLDVDRAVDGPDAPPPFEEFWRRVLEAAAGRPVSADVGRTFITRFRELADPPHLFSDAKRCLDRLARDGRRLAVVSNSSSEPKLRARLAAVGIDRYFEAILSSGTEGVAKPDPRLFERAVERLGVRKDRSLHVGNQRWWDAKAAARAGLHGVWLRRDGTGFGDDPPEITSLSELPAYVAELDGALVK